MYFLSNWALHINLQVQSLLMWAFQIFKWTENHIKQPDKWMCV